MDRRGLAESLGAGLVSGVLAVVGQWFAVGAVDWVLVVGLVAGVAIAAAANYRARTGHAEAVVEEAPGVTAQNYEEFTQPAAGDGGTEGMESSDGQAADERD